MDTSADEGNAVLVGGPQPIGSRQVHVEQEQTEVIATARDGSGEHGWALSNRHQAAKAHGGILRVYTYAGPVDRLLPP